MIHIGTDILEVSRIKKNIESKKDRFLNRIFTEKEIMIYLNKITA